MIMFKRILCFLIISVFLPTIAFSAEADFSFLSNAELVELDGQLAQEMIRRGLYVYVSLTGTKYHNKTTCSKMKAVMRVPLDDALGCGYEACKKCYSRR